MIDRISSRSRIVGRPNCTLLLVFFVDRHAQALWIWLDRFRASRYQARGGSAPAPPAPSGRHRAPTRRAGAHGCRRAMTGHWLPVVVVVPARRDRVVGSQPASAKQVTPRKPFVPRGLEDLGAHPPVFGGVRTRWSGGDVRGGRGQAVLPVAVEPWHLQGQGLYYHWGRSHVWASRRIWGSTCGLAFTAKASLLMANRAAKAARTSGWIVSISALSRARAAGST